MSEPQCGDIVIHNEQPHTIKAVFGHAFILDDSTVMWRPIGVTL